MSTRVKDNSTTVKDKSEWNKMSLFILSNIIKSSARYRENFTLGRSKFQFIG